MRSRKVKFDGIEWLKKKGLYVNTYKRKMDLIEVNLKDKVVLDMGCGSGGKMDYFSQFVRRIYGIDINERGIKSAKERYGSAALSFIIGNVEQTPFKDSVFDVVYSTWVIEHLKNPKKLINEAYRVLKPGGVLILWVPNVKNIVGFSAKITPHRLKAWVLKVLLRESKVSHHKCYYRANSVRKLDKLCKGKFERMYLERFDHIGYYKNSRVLSYLWFLAYKLTSNRLLDWTHLNFYVEYRKCS